MVFIIAILTVLLAAILAIPVEVIFKIHRQTETQSDIAIVWLFGIVRLPVSGSQSEPSAKNRRKKSKTPKRDSKRDRKSTNFSAIKDLFLNARFRYRLIKFVKDIIKTVRFAGFYLRIRLGLDDPADTGRLWAYMGPLAVYLTNLSNAAILLEPDFQCETLAYEGSGRVRIVPLQVVYTVLAFFFSPVTIHAIWRMRNAGKQ